jgi:hypothetical protein
MVLKQLPRSIYRSGATTNLRWVRLPYGCVDFYCEDTNMVEFSHNYSFSVFAWVRPHPLITSAPVYIGMKTEDKSHPMPFCLLRYFIFWGEFWRVEKGTLEFGWILKCDNNSFSVLRLLLHFPLFDTYKSHNAL